MDYLDLETKEAKKIVRQLNELITTLSQNNLSISSWYGTLLEDEIKQRYGTLGWIRYKIFGEIPKLDIVGLENRGKEYKPLPGANSDDRIPWYLYWEIVWVVLNGPNIRPGMKILDGGGTSSLFTSYLAYLGLEVHSIDLDKRLVSNGNRIAQKMEWKMYSYSMNMKSLSFEDETFDHAYSICVFEHLNYATKLAALGELARILKPKGILSITFDYKNPAPCLCGEGYDESKINQLSSIGDIKRNFLSSGKFELIGNEFVDNGLSYLVHPYFDDHPYTFGAIFLRKL